MHPKQEPSSPAFPLFGKLPFELRQQIWLNAIDEASIDRIIRVAVYDLLGVTHYSCYFMGDTFCGRHGSCARYRYGVTIEPTFISEAMIDGYFTVTDKFPNPESSDALSSIGLACSESRHHFISEYPKTLKVYRSQWHSRAESRLVRCCPVRDVLLITAVPNQTIDEITKQGIDEDYYESSISRREHIFPRDAALFSGFQDIVSSFQQVAFYYTGNRAPDSESDDDSEWPLPNITAKAKDLLNSTDLLALLTFFQSLENLYLWPDPEYYPELRGDPIKINDAEDLSATNRVSQRIYEVATEFKRDYNHHAGEISAHYVDLDEHWVVRPKMLLQIGCYATNSWLEGNESTN